MGYVEKKYIAEAKKSLFEKTICYAKKNVQIIEQILETFIKHRAKYEKSSRKNNRFVVD